MYSSIKSISLPFPKSKSPLSLMFPDLRSYSVKAKDKLPNLTCIKMLLSGHLKPIRMLCSFNQVLHVILMLTKV